MNNATEFPSAVSEPKRRNILLDFLIRLATEKPLGTFGGIIVLIFILVAIFADILAPYPYDEVNILDRMQEPSDRYLLGTDQLGRDLLETALSFLGFGLPVKVPSWGGMLSREGREFMEMAPRLALWPGLCLTIVVYSLNMFGDALRDLLDPRLRGGEGSYGIAKVKRKRGLLARLISPFNW